MATLRSRQPPLRRSQQSDRGTVSARQRPALFGPLPGGMGGWNIQPAHFVERHGLIVMLPIVERLDESIRGAIPGLHYAVKWKRPYYGLPELGWIIELAAYDVSVNVVFFGGADFDSPPPLGTTDRSPYVKVTTVEEAQRPELRNSIEEASRTPGWR
jgi:hypothetical protein